MKSSVFLTTPIYYVNDIPHIGHSYCTLATDTLARFARTQVGAENSFFLTGTDENSQKTVDAAAKAGVSTKIYLEDMAARWRACWDTIGISYDDFIRTTEQRHIDTVHDLFQKIYDKGDIYKGTYKGLYCTGCETFKKSSDLNEDGRCVDHPNQDIKQLDEENYFFRLSAYEKPLLEWYEQNPDWLQPKSKKNEILSFIKSGLEDVSVSRETAEFGISLPMDPAHKVYVWFDALINYYSATRTPEKEHFWASAYHIIGKDITRFHCVIWPAMLMAAGISLPKGVFAHGFFTIDGTKMSKSLGNVISPVDLSAQYGNDALRAGLLSSFEFGSDGDFSADNFAEFYRTKLAGGVGNLFNRVTVLIHKFCDGNVAEPENGAVGQDLKDTFKALMEKKQLKGAYDFYFATVDAANQRLNETEVWKLAKVDPAAAAKIFTELYGYLWFLADMAEVLLPESAPKMRAMVGTEGKVGEAVILFDSGRT
jgi:methionyl-tRNA synthetase